MGMVHGGRVVARAFKSESVPFVFTLCGGHVMPIYDGCLDEGIGVIDVRHEQTAAHAADGWARVTGNPGVAIVTAGPGLTDAVTGVASAQRAIPVSGQSACGCAMNCTPTGKPSMLNSGSVMVGHPSADVAALNAGSPVTKP